MGIIKQLDYETAVLVAAGEMIERPASVVKELVENSIDAGASKITVEIQNGGVKLIRVSDNGCGMAKEDLPLSIKRNATSKIRTSDDIEKILTLGFRGEALASIAVCSHLRIRSKQSCDDVGCELQIAPGMDTPVISEAPMANGTTIIVEDLFSNIPARRKFLKKDATETSYVTDLFEKLALSNPSVAMTLIADGKQKYSTPGNGDMKSAIYAVKGAEFANKLIPLEYRNDVKLYGGSSVDIAIEGFIGTPDNNSGIRSNQIFFVNGRSIRSRCMQSALETSYGSYIEISRYPACVMFVTVPPQFVDVNIHPTKQEIKFVSDKAVFEAIHYAVRGALERSIPIPKMDFTGMSIGEVNYSIYKSLNSFVPLKDNDEPTPPKPVYNNQRNVKVGQISVNDIQNCPSDAVVTTRSQEMAQAQEKAQAQETEILSQESAPVTPHAADFLRPTSESRAFPTDNYFYQRSRVEPITAQDVRPDPKPTVFMAKEELERLKRDFADSAASVKALPEYKIIGEAFLSYVFVEVGDKVMIIDKHAAHERIIFEELRANMRNKLASGECQRQILLSPIKVCLSAANADTAAEYREDIEAVGFEFSLQDGEASITAIPVELTTASATEMFETVTERLTEGMGSAALTKEMLFEKALYQASCKAAIKIGREYDTGHLKYIIEKLLTLDDIKVCPHGRPVAFEMTKSAIEHNFKRL